MPCSSIGSNPDPVGSKELLPFLLKAAYAYTSRPVERVIQRSVKSADRHIAIGLELLAMMLTVTEDGSINAVESRAFRDWLSAHRSADFPGMSHVVGPINEIVASGRVAEPGRRVIHAVLESVLPPHLRRYTTSRRDGPALEVEAMFRQSWAGKGTADGPVLEFEFILARVGGWYRTRIVENSAKEGLVAYFSRDKDSQQSPNAILVFLEGGGVLGQVPEVEAREIAHYLDAGYKAAVRIKRLLNSTRGFEPIPVIRGEIFAPDSTADGALSQSEMVWLNIGYQEPKWVRSWGLFTLVLIVGFAVTGLVLALLWQE